MVRIPSRRTQAWASRRRQWLLSGPPGASSPRMSVQRMEPHCSVAASRNQSTNSSMTSCPPHQVGQDAAASGQNAAGVAAAAYAVAQAGQRTDKVRIFPALHAQNEQRQHLAAAIAFLIQGENGIFQGVHDGLRSGWRNGADVFADVPEKRRSVQYGRRRGRVGQKKAELPPKRPASKFRQGRGACSIFSF